MAGSDYTYPSPSDMYLSGLSIPEVSEATGIARSTLRFRFKKEGIIRDRADSVRIAASKGKLGGGFRGKKRKFTDEHCAAISTARTEWAKENAAGLRINSGGYIEYTSGDQKGRCVHVVTMEHRLGRRLMSDEHVHHIDGDKRNNSENNLALLTVSGHARLHRLQDQLSGNIRERNENGRFC